jgi:hypothetical protein
VLPRARVFIRVLSGLMLVGGVRTRRARLVGSLLFVIIAVATVTPGSAPASAASPWSPIEIAGSPGGYSYLTGVSCSSPGNCIAVGQDHNDQPMYDTESNGTWGTPIEVAGSPGGSGGFNAVSCNYSGVCFAVGFDGNNQPMIDDNSSGGFGTPTQAPGGAPDGGEFFGVSCSEALCTAVGYDGENQPIYDDQGISGWNNVGVLTGGPSGSSFYAVGCSFSGNGDCTAVGGDGADQPIYANYVNGSWTSPALVPGSPGGEAFLFGVSCPTDENCTAVGTDYAVDLPVTATESNGVWSTPITLNNTAGDARSGQLTAVKCLEVGYCTAVGGGDAGTGPDVQQPIYAVESAGTWSPFNVSAGASGGGGVYYGVSCSEVGDCTAVGVDDDNQPIYAYTLAAPAISSFKPVSGRVGTVVTIEGSYLDGATKVSFNGAKATVVEKDSATQIKVTVPAGATTGKIKVVVPGGQAKTATVFTVT